MRRLTAVVGVVGVMGALCGSALAQGTKLWTQSRYDEMERGTTEGVAIRNDGRLQVAPASSLLYATSGNYVWSIAADGAGNAYLGPRRNDGRIGDRHAGDARWQGNGHLRRQGAGRAGAAQRGAERSTRRPRPTARCTASPAARRRAIAARRRWSSIPRRRRRSRSTSGISPSPRTARCMWRPERRRWCTRFRRAEARRRCCSRRWISISAACCWGRMERSMPAATARA